MPLHKGSSCSPGAKSDSEAAYPSCVLETRDKEISGIDALPAGPDTIQGILQVLSAQHCSRLARWPEDAESRV